MSATPRHPQTPSTFALGALMSGRAGIVVIVGALLTGAVRPAVADRGAGDRAKEKAANALRVYAARYVLAGARLTPTYARQTGLACSACHTHFPELTPTGRAFKLNGYVFRRSESLEGKSPEGQQSLLLNLVAPVSLMFQTSYQHEEGAARHAEWHGALSRSAEPLHRRGDHAARGWFPPGDVRSAERSARGRQRGLPFRDPCESTVQARHARAQPEQQPHGTRRLEQHTSVGFPVRQLGGRSHAGRDHAGGRYARPASGGADRVYDVERSRLRGIRRLPLGAP